MSQEYIPEEDHVIFFISKELKEEFREMCSEKTKERKKGVVTMSYEIRRLMKREIEKHKNSPF